MNLNLILKFIIQMEYDISLIDLKKRTLEISVINNKLNNKEKIGSVEIRLYDIEWNNNEYIKWYDLSRQIVKNAFNFQKQKII